MRIKAIVSYDGTAYHGWQIQKQYPTIQLRIEEGLQRICAKPVPVTGAGRTDSGVHALRQVAHFDWNHWLPIDKLRLAINSQLPEDIRARELEEVSEKFHARFDAASKTYLYRIDRSRIYDPFNYRFAWHYPFSLELNAIQKCADILLGEHDFLAFQASGTDVVTTKRSVLEVRISHDNAAIDSMPGGMLSIRVTATGFLRKMMRFLVGTMIEIAGGKRSVQDFHLALETGDRKYVGVPAPARGLFLEEVHYQNLQ